MPSTARPCTCRPRANGADGGKNAQCPMRNAERGRANASRKGLAMARKAVRVKISGRVTGVCFRFCALDRSRTLPSLAGHVRNLGHGEVEAFIQGEEQEVEAMVAWLGHGPPAARVDAVEVAPAALDPACRGFEIR